MPTKQPTTKSRTEPRTEPARTEPRTEPPRSAAPPVSTEIVSTGIGGLAFEWFLELPVQVVLLVLWVAGIGFFGVCALLTYMGISALVEMVGGAF
jgi:hypothetical protein